MSRGEGEARTYLSVEQILLLFFSLNPEQGIKIDQKFLNRLCLFLEEQ